MSNNQRSFIQLLGSTILPKILFIALGISLLGIILYIMGNAAAEMLLLAGLTTLAACYFLSGFMPPVTNPDSKPSLYSFVISKIIYISLSVTLMGILFAVLQLEGADMLLIGCGVLTIGLLISGVMVVTNHDNLTVLKNPLLHGIGILLVGVYFINKLSLISF